MSRPSYKRAIQWLANNDDTSWVDGETEVDRYPSVTAALVVDLFDKTEEQVRNDVRRELRLLDAKDAQQSKILAETGLVDISELRLVDYVEDP